MNTTSGLPITNICVISERKNCPPRYTILDQTVDGGDDADFWKDKLFKSKVTRYLCYTKDMPQNQIPQVVTDMAIVGIKDSIPHGYTAINLTSDTHEQALRKQVLCVRFVLKNMTTSAVLDVCLFKDNSYKDRKLTLVGEVNGINLTFLLGSVTLAAIRPPPPVPAVNQVLLGAPPTTQTLVAPLQASVQKMSVKQPMTGIEGIPFKLNDRLLNKDSANTNQGDLLKDMTIRTQSELENLTEYNFSQEKKLINVT